MKLTKRMTELAQQQGWSDATILNLALDYIEDVDVEGFEAFLSLVADKEND